MVADKQYEECGRLTITIYRRLSVVRNLCSIVLNSSFAIAGSIFYFPQRDCVNKFSSTSICQKCKHTWSTRVLVKRALLADWYSMWSWLSASNVYSGVVAAKLQWLFLKHIINFTLRMLWNVWQNPCQWMSWSPNNALVGSRPLPVLSHWLSWEWLSVPYFQ